MVSHQAKAEDFDAMLDGLYAEDFQKNLAV
jgi:hypothetical protein